MLKRALFSTIVVASSLLLLPSACGGDTDADGAVVVQTVGRSGGAVDGSGVRLVLPEGAVAGDTTITILPDPAAKAPQGYTASSPIYVFGPDGFVFQKPVAIEIAIGAQGVGPDDGIVWVSGDKVEELASTRRDGVLTANVSHFSFGLIGKRQPGANLPPVDAAAPLDASISDGGVDAGTTTDASVSDAATDASDAKSDAATDASTCKSNGGACTTDGQCCSGVCNGVTSTCGAPATCKLMGAACGASVDCCSGLCSGGSCK